MLRRLTEKITTSQPHMLVEQAQNACMHGWTVCEDVFVCVVSCVLARMWKSRRTKRLANDEIFDHDCRVCSAHLPTNRVCPLTPVQRPSNAMAVVDANATVVANTFTLQVAVEDISTEGEAKGLKTAHETLLDEAGWTRPYCFGGAVQKGKFRPVSGFLNGLREGYKAVTEPGYAGQLSAYGTLAATASEELEAFKKFTK